MNDTSFGSTEEALILANILEKNPYDRKKIAASFNEYTRVLNEIINSDLSKRLKRHFLKSIWDRFKLKMNRYDGEVKTFSLNVLSQIYRKHLNSIQ